MSPQTLVTVRAAIFAAAYAEAAPALAHHGVGGALALSGVMLVLSNLVSNVPAMLLASPVVLAAGGLRATWLIVAMSATLAGNLVLIGSMANLIVAERAATRGAHLASSSTPASASRSRC